MVKIGDTVWFFTAEKLQETERYFNLVSLDNFHLMSSEIVGIRNLAVIFLKDWGETMFSIFQLYKTPEAAKAALIKRTAELTNESI